MNLLPLFTLETWILLITLICLFVVYGKGNHEIFEKLGIPGPKPVIYFGTINRLDPVYYQDDRKSVQKYGKIWGIFELRKPMVVVMDPEMLKTILVKECFTHFTNRRNLRLNGELYDSISIAEDGKWRRIRNTLSPLFTSGRIKQLFGLMKHQSSKLVSSLEPKAQNEEVITVKEYFGSYLMNIVTGCLFSTETEPSLFMKHSSALFRVSVPIFLLQGCFPVVIPLLKMLGVSLFNRDAINFVIKVVEKIRADRGGGSQQEFDFLQHMINTQIKEADGDKRNEGLTDHEIVSQVAVLLLGGYETSANTMVFCAYNLAGNPRSMKRLQEEIDSTFPEQAPVTYQALMEMEYLDCVVNECLRLYPPIPRIDRTAKETVKVGGVTIPKDMIVMVPIYALHRDPEYWPDPDQFQPDRFNKQNKGRIQPYTFLPFGIGPRNCLGMRLAQVMVKLALVDTLRRYSFLVCQETEIPLKMDREGLLGPVHPIKLRVARR